jgi:hypothetical protein
VRNLQISAYSELTRLDRMIYRDHDLHQVVFDEVINRKGEGMGQRVDSRVLMTMETDYCEELAKTCGADLATDYQKRVSYSLRSTVRTGDHIFDAVIATADLFFKLVDDFKPFLASFVHNTMKLCNDLGISRLVIQSRDGDIFYVIAKILSENLFRDIDVKLEPINRRLFGIEDRPIGLDGRTYSRLVRNVAYKISQSQATLEYLNRVFGDHEKVAILDSGVYGALVGIISYLHEMNEIEPEPNVFFFASRNPYIYGFVNQHLASLPVPVNHWQCWLELFADTIEAIAKTSGSARPQLEGKRLSMVTSPIENPLYEASSWGTLVALRDYALNELPKDIGKISRPDLLMKKLYFKYREAVDGRVIASLFLERHAPPSPYGAGVLKDWDRGLIPPQGFLLGYGQVPKSKLRVYPFCSCDCY